MSGANEISDGRTAFNSDATCNPEMDRLKVIEFLKKTRWAGIEDICKGTGVDRVVVMDVVSSVVIGHDPLIPTPADKYQHLDNIPGSEEFSASCPRDTAGVIHPDKAQKIVSKIVGESIDEATEERVNECPEEPPVFGLDTHNAAEDKSGLLMSTKKTDMTFYQIGPNLFAKKDGFGGVVLFDGRQSFSIGSVELNNLAKFM